MNRTDYWNENYLKYWEQKVMESNGDEQSINKDDCKTPGDETVCKWFDLLNVTEKKSLLDFGCGFCRFYDYFKNKKAQYYGIDISKAMIEKSKVLYPELSEQLFVSEGESLPFADNTFDFIACFGVFDACYQDKALAELLRVLKSGGKALITGKNNNYYIDDEIAMLAEVNARKKGHYNYFTDVSLMLEQLKTNNISIEHQAYFLRRGDFQTEKYIDKKPENFYEYAFILTKNSDAQIALKPFSDAFSETFKKISS